jgi:multidrug efflux pump subunit AcrB
MRSFLALPMVTVAAIAAAWSALLAAVVVRVMAARVNRQAAEGERIASVLRGGRNLRKRYKEIYPRTWLVLVLDVSVAVLMLSLIALVASALTG